ncbi:MAG: hypothetical protein ACTH1Z_07855 [Ancrocorticia sp.]
MMRRRLPHAIPNAGTTRGLWALDCEAGAAGVKNRENPGELA